MGQGGRGLLFPGKSQNSSGSSAARKPPKIPKLSDFQMPDEEPSQPLRPRARSPRRQVEDWMDQDDFGAAPFHDSDAMSELEEIEQPEEDCGVEAEASAIDTVQGIWEGVTENLEQQEEEEDQGEEARISQESGDVAYEEPPSGAQPVPVAVRPVEMDKDEADLSDDESIYDLETGIDIETPTNLDDEDPDSAPELQGQRPLPHDPTEAVPHNPKDFTMTPTAFKFAVFLTEHQLSRSAWAQLTEILRTSPQDELRQLPKEKSQLMKTFTDQLPLPTLRSKTLNLDASKLPSRASHTETMLCFDLKSMLQTLLNSKSLFNMTHRGMAHYRSDNGSEMWETRVWGESLRTTSGKFHHFPDGSPIFPSDFVYYNCQQVCCTIDHQHHMGRVTWAGLDFSKEAEEQNTTGHKIVLIEPLYTRDALPSELQDQFSTLPQFSPRDCDQNEVILHARYEVKVLASLIIKKLDVFMFYSYDPSKSATHKTSTEASFVLRYIFDDEVQGFRALILSAPHRGELELDTYGRDWFTNHFDGQDIVSMPYKPFCDAFGAYRNMYRSILGFYVLPAWFPDKVNTRRSSVIPIMLAPFGSDDAEVLECLAHLAELDRGCNMSIQGKDMLVCAFPLCFIGDMVQQQEMSGCLGHQANLPCRECLVKKNQRNDLSFDITNKGRYYHHMKSVREAAKGRPLVTHKRSALQAFGFMEDSRVMRAVEAITPALDPYTTRPADAAHSEFTSLVKHVHKIIVNNALLAKHQQDFLNVFQTFPIPPSFKRIQSPIAHLESWRIMEAGMASIFVPVVLRHWLKKQHMNNDFSVALRREAPDFLPSLSTLAGHDLLIRTLWNIAESNLLVCGRNPPKLSRDKFIEIVHTGRRSMQLLFQAAAVQAKIQTVKKTQTGKGSKRTAPPESQAPDNVSEASAVTNISGVTGLTQLDDEDMDPQSLKGYKKALAFSRLKGLPNVHVGLHLWEISRTWGYCRHVFTLLGEDKHRDFKGDIKNTNHREAASTLVKRERVRKTSFFGLAGSFESTHPQVHAAFQDLRRDCPSISTRIENKLQIGAFAEEETPPSRTYAKLDIIEDDNHHSPRLFGILKRSEVISCEDNLIAVIFPAQQPRDSVFNTSFRIAYDIDYGWRNVPIERGDMLKWGTKLTFTTRFDLSPVCLTCKAPTANFMPYYFSDKRNCCFKLYDFVWVRNRDLVRIDGIFIHRISSAYRIFLVVTAASNFFNSQRRDEILDCPIYDITEQRLIVGLPALLPDVDWIIEREDHTLLHVPYDIFLV